MGELKLLHIPFFRSIFYFSIGTVCHCIAVFGDAAASLGQRALRDRRRSCSGTRIQKNDNEIAMR